MSICDRAGVDEYLASEDDVFGEILDPYTQAYILKPTTGSRHKTSSLTPADHDALEKAAWDMGTQDSDGDGSSPDLTELGSRVVFGSICWLAGVDKGQARDDETFADVIDLYTQAYILVPGKTGSRHKTSSFNWLALRQAAWNLGVQHFPGGVPDDWGKTHGGHDVFVAACEAAGVDPDLPEVHDTFNLVQDAYIAGQQGRAASRRTAGQTSWTETSLSSMSDEDLDDNLAFWSDNGMYSGQGAANLKMLQAEKARRSKQASRTASDVMVQTDSGPNSIHSYLLSLG